MDAPATPLLRKLRQGDSPGYKVRLSLFVCLYVYSPSCPGMYSVDQAELEIPLSLPLNAEIKEVCHHIQCEALSQALRQKSNMVECLKFQHSED